MQKLKLKRIKKKGEIPTNDNIHCINNVFLNKQRFKIFLAPNENWRFNTELYLFNTENMKWYKIVNEIS